MGTIDSNGHYVNTTEYDWDNGITTDKSEIESAAKNARVMISILENGAKRGGFDEKSVLDLLDAFMVVGQWSRGSGYERGVALHFTFHRKPRAIAPGQKYSHLLLFWLRKFVISWDSKDRRKSFDEIQSLMFDLVWQFHRTLLEQDATRANKFGVDLRTMVLRDYRESYRFRW